VEEEALSRTLSFSSLDSPITRKCNTAEHFRLFTSMTAGELGVQIIELLLIALPIASISWTITHEEVFREPREFCARCSKQARHVLVRKFFYLFTCEYCFSHWVTAFFLIITRYKLIFPDWRGYLLGLFALVWMANQYMSIFDRLRLNIKRERVEIKGEEHEVKRKTEGPRAA
jgi:hypothetical protein